MIEPRLSEVYKTLEGLRFHGIFTDPEDRFDGDTTRASRILRVNTRAPVATGSIVRAHNQRYLTLIHSEAEDQRRFLCYQVTHRVLWTRQTDTIDPVTKMKKTGVVTEQDPDFHLAVEPIRVHENLGLERPHYVIRCPEGVIPGDKLGDFTINTVRSVQGVAIVEAF